MTASASQEPRVYAIGELCKAFNVTPRTLRFYEQKGLLNPERIGERRLFSHRDRARLILILRGKRFGFSLNEIGALLDLYDPTERNRTQLAATLSLAEDRLAAMRAQHAELGEAIDDLDQQIQEVSARLDTDEE